MTPASSSWAPASAEPGWRVWLVLTIGLSLAATWAGYLVATDFLTYWLPGYPTVDWLCQGSCSAAAFGSIATPLTLVGLGQGALFVGARRDAGDAFAWRALALSLASPAVLVSQVSTPWALGFLCTGLGVAAWAWGERAGQLGAAVVALALAPVPVAAGVVVLVLTPRSSPGTARPLRPEAIAEGGMRLEPWSPRSSATAHEEGEGAAPVRSPRLPSTRDRAGRLGWPLALTALAVAAAVLVARARLGWGFADPVPLPGVREAAGVALLGWLVALPVVALAAWALLDEDRRGLGAAVLLVVVAAVLTGTPVLRVLGGAPLIWLVAARLPARAQPALVAAAALLQGLVVYHLAHQVPVL